MTADHARWRTGALFAIMAGATGLTVLGLAAWADITRLGWAYLKRSGGLLFPFIGGLFCAALMAAGIALYVFVDREAARYKRFMAETRNAKAELK